MGEKTYEYLIKNSKLTVTESSLRDGGRGIAMPDVGVGVCLCFISLAGCMTPTSWNKSCKSTSKTIHPESQVNIYITTWCIDFTLKKPKIFTRLVLLGGPTTTKQHFRLLKQSR